LDGDWLVSVGGDLEGDLDGDLLGLGEGGLDGGLLGDLDELVDGLLRKGIWMDSSRGGCRRDLDELLEEDLYGDLLYGFQCWIWMKT
jgi:hypothetical protein